MPTGQSPALLEKGFRDVGCLLATRFRNLVHESNEALVTHANPAAHATGIDSDPSEKTKDRRPRLRNDHFSHWENADMRLATY